WSAWPTNPSTAPSRRPSTPSTWCCCARAWWSSRGCCWRTSSRATTRWSACRCAWSDPTGARRGCCSGGLDDLATLHDQLDVVRLGDQLQVLERVAAHSDQVAPVPRLERAHAGVADGAGGHRGSRLQATQRVHAQLLHEQELLAHGAMRPDPGVGAEGDRHAGLQRALEGALVVLHGRTRLGGGPLRHATGFSMPEHPERRHQRGHQGPFAVEHQLAAVVVQPDTVLDGG